MATTTEYKVALYFKDENNSDVTITFPDTKNELTLENVQTVANYMIDNPILFKTALSTFEGASLITTETKKQSEGADYDHMTVVTTKQKGIV